MQVPTLPDLSAFLPDAAEYLFVLVSYQQVIEAFVVVVAVLVLVSSIDDAFIDLSYWVRRFYRWFWVEARTKAVDLDAMIAVPEQPIAIMVPAWQEYDVIYDMLATNVSLLRYADYRFFVGTYPNDARTQAEVRRAMEAFPGRIALVVTPDDGPTSKADCLNAVIAEIQADEARSDRRFAGIALHDSEDVIHPFELLLFNYLLTRGNDFIQLPVYSFPRRLTQFVAGSYMDEFAEWHTKDLIVREALTGAVPCAGTSACFSRDSIAQLIDEARGTDEVFRRGSLTEDYDVAFRLKKLGRKAIFVRFPVRVVFERAVGFGDSLIFERLLPIATREYFPDEFRAAYRQRARWLLGIVFQGWSQHGWGGTLGMQYFFLRDRKGVLTAPISVIAYFLGLNILVLQLLWLPLPKGSRLGFDTLTSEWFGWLLLANLIFLLNRIVQRSYFTTRIYGWPSGLMAGPRILMSNLLNFYAVLRALRVYAVHRLTGKAIGWDKTSHTFPTAGRTPSAIYAAGTRTSMIPAGATAAVDQR